MMIEPKISDNLPEITWVARLPLARDPVFVRQMSLVFLIPLAVLGIIMVVIEWPLDMQRLGMIAKVVLLTGAVLLVLYLFVIFGVLRGRQEIRYTLDAKSAREETAGPLKYMNIVKLLLVLSGKPTFASIGLMAQGPKSARITWKRVEKVLPDPQARTVTLRKGRTDLMVLHCMEENYEQVLSWAQARAEN
jgi:vacuolar-type H+-ATPase subunit I/STV1